MSQFRSKVKVCGIFRPEWKCPVLDSALKIRLTHSPELGSIKEMHLLLPQESFKLEISYPASAEYCHWSQWKSSSGSGNRSCPHRSSWISHWYKNTQPFRQQIKSRFTEKVSKKAIWDQLHGIWGTKVQQSWISPLQQGQGNFDPSQHSPSWTLQHDSLHHLTSPNSILCNDGNTSRNKQII